MSARPAAIVPYRAKTPKIVQFAADGVAADVGVEPLDLRTGTNLYAIRLASADSNLTGRLIGVLPGGDTVELGDIAVAAGSIAGARLTVATPRGGYRSVYLEIRSERMLLQVEAPNPPRPRRVHPLAAIAALLAVGLVSAGGGALALAVPQPPMLRGPDRATAGDTVRLQYATRGYGAAHFSARYDDGVVFTSGALDAKSGEITLALPAAAVSRRISVVVSTQGLLGGAAGITSFAVEAPPARIVPRPPVAVVAHRDVAPAPRPQDPAPVRAPSAIPLPLPAPAGVTPVVPSETAGMLVFESRAVAGTPLAVRVMPHRTAMTVSLQGPSGETLAERDVAPGTTRITLPLPERPATYFLLLRYDGEDGVQTVVRSVRTVAARADQQISR